jgi:hypothetical protein
MSSLKVEALHREFLYNGTRIPDPAPNLTVEQVRKDDVLPRNCHGDTGRTGGYRRRPSLHVQPGHRQQGLILRLQAVSRCDLLPRPVRRLLCKGVGRYSNHRNKAAHHEDQESQSDPPSLGTPSA